MNLLIIGWFGLAMNERADLMDACDKYINTAIELDAMEFLEFDINRNRQYVENFLREETDLIINPNQKEFFYEICREV